MALVLLPGLTNLIDDISEEKKLPPQVVEAALRPGFIRRPFPMSIVDPSRIRLKQGVNTVPPLEN